MLCTKCGQEYEGSQCPRCDGPVILVNNSDYLARRKAYEEKQALKERSASSDKKEESQSDYGQALAKRVQAIKKQSRNKTESKKQSQNRSKADSRKQSQSKAGFVSSVVMIIQKYSLVHFLWVLVAVMAGFYMAGLLLRVILNKAFKDLETEEEKPSEDEGTAGEGEGTPEQTEEEQQEEK